MYFDTLNTTIVTSKQAVKIPVSLSFNAICSTILFFLCAFPAHAVLEGELETATCDQIKGWAWDNTAPNTPKKVSVFDVNIKTNTTTRLITLTAQQFRGDLLKTGQFNDNGKHGFSFMVPATVRNAVKHTFSVRFEGTTTELARSPLPTPTACFGKLNDTGMLNCSTNALNGVKTCPVTGFEGQDADYGRDAKKRAGLLKKTGAGIASFDYTKIANDGAKLSAKAVLGKKPKDWACTLDNVTGLMWEVKTNDGGLRDKDNGYTWYNPDYTTNGGDEGAQRDTYLCTGICNTYTYQQAVNAIKLCGKSDWRLPTVDELTSLLYFGSHDAIDRTYFPNTDRLFTDWEYLTSSTVARYNYFIWTVAFQVGGIGTTRKAINGYVQLVRDSGQ